MEDNKFDPLRFVVQLILVILMFEFVPMWMFAWHMSCSNWSIINFTFKNTMIRLVSSKLGE